MELKRPVQVLSAGPLRKALKTNRLPKIIKQVPYMKVLRTSEDEEEDAGQPAEQTCPAIPSDSERVFGQRLRARALLLLF